MRAQASARPLTALLFTLSSISIATRAAAVDPPAPLAHAEPGWHIIRPGDTLESLAQTYLGDTRRWNEIHRLNPGIDDPHWIYPGRRIRVVIERPSATPNAQVTALARRVEARPEPVPWRPADQGDLLLERDGLRTFEKASARLLFDDGTTATVSEESLVFIRRQTPARSATPKKEIEVVLGQTDLEATQRPSLATPEIEVVVAGAKSTSRPGADGAVRSRSRRAGDGAQFMLYEGSGEVAAQGAAVELAAGTGTVVSQETAPAPPEPLLAAPALVEPADGSELGRDAPVVRWAPVAGARRYVVELCADAACGSVRERQREIDGTEATLAEPLADGDSYWRVTAVAPSELDGFPSAVRRLVAVDSVAPPQPTLILAGVDGGPLAPEIVLSQPPVAQVHAVDRRGQPLDWRLLVDGGEGPADALARLATNGRHEVVAVARDRRGREARSAPASFELDVDSPRVEAPGTRRSPAPFLLCGQRPPRPCDAELEVWDERVGWVEVACDEADGGATELALAGLAAELRLRSKRVARLGDRRMGARVPEATIAASDVGSGLTMARLRVASPSEGAEEGRLTLEVDLFDRAGRVGTESWPIELR